MSDILNHHSAKADFTNDNRSDHDMEYFLNLRVRMDKKTLEEFVSFFPESNDGNLPAAVRWFLGGKFEYKVYLSNAANDEHPDSVNMVLASDSENRNNKDLLAELGGMTLSIFGFNTPEWFYVTKIKKLPSVVGSVSNRIIKANICFFYNAEPSAQSIPRTVLNRVFELPNVLEETKNINTRIAHWDEYLKLNEKIAEDSQLIIDYTAYRESEYVSLLTFSVSCSKLTPAHINSNIILVCETEFENGHPVYRGPVMGTVSSYDEKNELLGISIDFEFGDMLESGRFVIPPKGKLFISKWGDLVQIRRLRYGLQTFARGQAANPYLDVFLFDSSKARLPYENGETLYTENLLHKSLNTEQKSAVEGVINCDDLYLIQGPPGTGKTTVIAEICYQNAIRGLKTLIASQTNLAVDNALGKLCHHPKIRALRKGNEQSVQAEGKLFTENNVISNWLEKTSADCKKAFAPGKRELEKARIAEENLSSVKKAYESFLCAAKERASYGIEKSSLESACRLCIKKVDWISENIPIFLEYTDDLSAKNLISNPFGVSEDFLEEIALYYKTKCDTDKKRASFKDSIDKIRGFLSCYGEKAELLASLVKKLDRKNEFSVVPSSDTDAPECDFAQWLINSHSIAQSIDKLIDKKPSAVANLLHLNKTWLKFASDAVRLFEKFRNVSNKIMEVQKNGLKEVLNTNPLPAMAEKIRNGAKVFLDEWESDLKANKTKLDDVLQKYENAKAQIASSREEINEFNSNLPYGTKPEAIELVCKSDDIIGYYKNLWNQKKADDEKLAGFVDGWTKRLDEKSEKDYKDFKQIYIDNANVIGITCSQSGSRDFTSLYPTFDVAIIDEVSKATPPELILSVLKAKKIVLVGDHKQLPPMLGSDTYEEIAGKLNISPESAEHMKHSLFEELFVKAPPQIKTMLSTQYRMHSQIMGSINQFYIEENGFGLKCGLANDDEQRKHFCHGKAINESDHSLWVDVPLFEENREIKSAVNKSYSNKAECDCIKDILLTLNDNLAANGFEGKKTIGLISFYANQVRMMETEFMNRDFASRINKLSLRIGTVDRFQGIECPVVICSFVRNNDRGEIGFAKDPRRVNVALSRAQELSVIVGCTELFCYSNNSPDASAIYKQITQNIFKAGGERSVWDFKQ